MHGTQFEAGLRLGRAFGGRNLSPLCSHHEIQLPHQSERPSGFVAVRPTTMGCAAFSKQRIGSEASEEFGEKSVSARPA